MKRLTRSLRLVAVNGLLLCAGIVILELVFGGWFDAENLNRLNLLRNYTRQYDVSHLYDDPRPIIRYSRDKYGLRGTAGQPGLIDILTVGGSTTDQRFIRDGETWQDVLQNCFSRAGTGVVVANAGVDGQSTHGHIKNFEWWFPSIPDLRPGYILFYVGLNDFYIDAGYSYDELAGSPQDRGLLHRLQDNSAVWHMVRTLRGAYEAMVVHKIGHRAIDFDRVPLTDDALQREYDFMAPRLQEYADRLRVLADRTQRFGAKAIFVSQPSRRYRTTPGGVVGDSMTGTYDDRAFNGVDYFHMMRKLDRVTAAVARECGAVFVDLASDAGWEDADFYDCEHMTPQGAAKVGALLWRALKDFVVGADRVGVNEIEAGQRTDSQKSSKRPDI